MDEDDFVITPAMHEQGTRKMLLHLYEDHTQPASVFEGFLDVYRNDVIKAHEYANAHDLTNPLYDVLEKQIAYRYADKLRAAGFTDAADWVDPDKPNPAAPASV